MCLQLQVLRSILKIGANQVWGLTKCFCTASNRSRFRGLCVLSYACYLCFVQYGGEEHLEAPAKELLLAQTVSTVITLPALAKARPYHTPQRMGETIPSLTQIRILQEQYVEYSRTGRVVKGA